MRGTLLRLIGFTLVCFLFTAWLAFTIGNVHTVALGPIQVIGKSTYPLHATFDDSSGLLPDDNVKVAGVVVGKVTGIHLRKGRSVVTMRLKDSIRVPSDSTAAIRWRNLLGQRYVYLYPGRSGTTMRSGDTIPRSHTRSVVDLGELFNRLGPIVKAIEPSKVNEFLRSFTAALEGNENNLGRAIHDLSLVAETLGDRDAAVGRLVTNLDAVTGAITDRDREIRTVLDNLASLATTFNAHTDVLVAASSDIDDFTNHLADLISGNRAAIDQTITDVDSIVQVIAARLPQLENAVTNLDDAGLRLFNASRYGEWLNQVIPCGAVTPTPGVNRGLDASCENGTHPAGASANSNGAASVSSLMRRAMGTRS